MTGQTENGRKLIVNGETRTVASATVLDLIEELGLQDRRVAVMVNESVVRRGDFCSRILAEGDQVEILSLIGGG